LTTVTEEECREDDNDILHPPLIPNGLHERNAEILKQVFLDLFDVMEKLQDTDSFRGEIEIDPTEYVVPVSWVRQQVRDIARHLFLEIVVHNKRRRAMKIRIRKRARFEESDSDDEGDYNRRMYHHRDTKLMEQFYYDDRRTHKPEVYDRFGCGRFASRSVDDEDHVTRCLLWIKGMKREKSMHFQSGIYPPDVMGFLKERAEELGLKLEVRESTMYISVNTHAHPYDEVPKLSDVQLADLNSKVQVAIKDYFVKIMMDSQSRGLESLVVPTKGYFMRPEWVAKQVMEIGKSAGFDAKERDGKVELYARPSHGLARYFSVPDQLHLPIPGTQLSQPLLVGNLSRSLSSGHYPPTNSFLNSHPVPLDQWNAQQHPPQMQFLQDESNFHDVRTPKAEDSNGTMGQFGRVDNHTAPEAILSRRQRRGPANDRRSNVREFPKPYWENGIEAKGNFDRRSRGRGKGRRGRGRNGFRAITHENGKTQNTGQR